MIAYFELVGFIAGMFTTFAFLPQIFKVLKTKSTADFSSGWLGMTLTGLSLWLIYGLFINSEPIIIFNFLSIIFVIIIIFFKISFNSIAVKN